MHWSRLELDDEASSPIQRAIRQILDYFLRHPEAVDSSDGIAYWRLLDEVNQPSLTDTEDGIGWLVSRGFLHKVIVPGSRGVYRLNPDMREEAMQFLRDERDRSRGDEH